MLTKQLPSEYLTEIGRITVQWSLLEQVVSLALITLLGKEVTEGRSHVIFAHVNFKQKLDMLSALINELLDLPPGLGKYKEDVLPKLRTAQKERNKVAHWVWDVEDGRVVRSSISAHGELEFQRQVITLRGLAHVTFCINSAIAGLGLAVFPDEDRFRIEGNTRKLF